MLPWLLLGVTTGREFLPELDEGALWLQVQLPTGLSLDKASEMAGQLRQARCANFPKYLTPSPSSAATTTAPTRGRLPTSKRPWGSSLTIPGPRARRGTMFLARFNARLQQLPVLSAGISQPIIDMVYDVIGGAHSPLVVRIIGDDFKELRRIGDGIVKVLDTVPGTASASIFQEPPIPQIVVDIDRGGRCELRHQCLRHHEPHPDRGGRGACEHGLCGRPHLRYHRAFPRKHAQQP